MKAPEGDFGLRTAQPGVKNVETGKIFVFTGGPPLAVVSWSSQCLNQAS